MTRLNLCRLLGVGETYLPSYMVQKAWGMPKEEIKKYIEFDHMYRCTIGGDKCLTVSWFVSQV